MVRLFAEEGPLCEHRGQAAARMNRSKRPLFASMHLVLDHSIM